jgi:NAD(P)-dependent dehydrogenase (short-subunit alcohol dehydrogenase family)
MAALEGKVTLVTGGTSNIGLAIARRFAAEGAEVVIAARGREGLDRAVELIGHGVRGLTADVSDPDQVRALIEPLPRIDHLVTCAGSAVFGPIDELPPQRWVELFAGRFFGQIYACHFAVPKMAPGSSIMLCSGIAARAGIPDYAGGAGLCGAVNSMGRALALELAPRGIRVNVLSPGLIMEEGAGDRLEPGDPRADRVLEFINERIPMHRPGQPKDMADAAMFLATCEYATGVVLDVDGGWTAI